MNEVIDPDPASLLDRARSGDGAALGRLLESYRGYLTVLAGVQIGRRLQGKVDAADVVQDAFLGAARDFGQFRGVSEAEFLGWLRQVLASVLANLVRHYQGTQRRNVRLECRLAVELDQSSQALDRGLASAQSSPSQQAARRDCLRAWRSAWKAWMLCTNRVPSGTGQPTARPRPRIGNRASCWATSAFFARLATAAWVSFTRLSRSRSGAALP